MTAISHGEADAISLHGENIYKASFKPFNLIPIITESYHYQKGGRPLLGAFVPKCDEKGNYSPTQCHGGTGYCWCVTAEGKEIDGTKKPPGESPTCGEETKKTPCLNKREKALSGGQPLLGAFAPDCDEEGNFKPRQCYGSTGYCWCVDDNGVEISATRTPPGEKPPTCGATDPVTCHYAVAVVKKSSTFQFNQLKGKRSCHSAVGESAGWVAPMSALLDKKFLLWEGPAKKSFEKAASEFFSASCAPGAKEENLCKQCAGQQDKCKQSPGEPYYGDEGAFRCLGEDKGDVAFVEHTVLSGQNPDNYELLCPDNIRRPLSKYKNCNFGKVPNHAVVTRSSGDKTEDIIEYLLEAQKKDCQLFSSSHGKNLLFEETTTKFFPLPSAMDPALFLGSELYIAMKRLHGEPLPSRNELRWCPQSSDEKKKCDDWSAVSGGAIKCTEPLSELKCIVKVLKGEADVVKVSLLHMHTALKCGLVPSVEEYHNEDFRPCETNAADYADFMADRVVAVVKKEDTDITWNTLRGKKSCHTGHINEWSLIVALLSKQSRTCDIGAFFNQSCAPGSPPDSSLCELCIGDPQNMKANTKCSSSAEEAYYGKEGAIRCLVERGDVAFVPHSAVLDNTDGKNPADWAKDLKSTDFELLCPDGSRAPFSDYKACRLGGVSYPAVFSREESTTDVARIILNLQSLYGPIGFQKDIFQMFSSSHGPNLLFSEGTQCLIEFDRIYERDIMADFLGTHSYDLMYRDNRCFPTSAMDPVCDFHYY
ncbi:hypothetical protein GDO81_007277 [Engystomops pustulosus]|uniref:Thyroglobulin type-1 domain-containing protein n=1 Tax=Engystomops pustulosus TaxID=76066 RepID=A0AAV7C620_ENGPU|nr:hypothetical protein GDO81_007277 [Engystomops pustulosus]